MRMKIGNYDGWSVGDYTGKDGVLRGLFVTDQGQWVAQVGEKVISDWQRSGLTDQIDKLTKRKIAKVAVPVIRVVEHENGITVRHGVLTGVHGSNDNPLVTWDLRGQDVKEQITDGNLYASDGRYFHDLTADQITELADLLKAKREAERAYRAFRDARGMNVRAAILAALDNAEE